jgi:hypothetical protein
MHLPFKALSSLNKKSLLHRLSSAEHDTIISATISNRPRKPNLQRGPVARENRINTKATRLPNEDPTQIPLPCYPQRGHTCKTYNSRWPVSPLLQVSDPWGVRATTRNQRAPRSSIRNQDSLLNQYRRNDLSASSMGVQLNPPVFFYKILPPGN